MCVQMPGNHFSILFVNLLYGTTHESAGHNTRKFDHHAKVLKLGFRFCNNSGVCYLVGQSNYRQQIVFLEMFCVGD